jgi:Tol biopolymer transport system component
MIAAPRVVASLAIAIASVALMAVTSPVRAQVVKQITHVKTGWTSLGEPDDAGDTIFAISTADPYGTNAQHRLQIFAWNPSTGAGQQLTAFDDGVVPLHAVVGVSVSDDGSRLAFLSRGDLTGENPDRNIELFVMEADGTGLVQLSHAPSPRDGLSYVFALSGNGSRVAFASKVDYLGNNPDHEYRVYVVDADGTDLRQLSAGEARWPSISDDGERIVYQASGIHGIHADGTNLHLIAPEGDYPAISGDGSTVAYRADGGEQCPTAIRAVDWEGTNDTLIAIAYIGDAAQGRAGPPDISDDGQVLVYPMWSLPESGSGIAWRIWRNNRDGSEWTQLTDSLSGPGPPRDCDWPRISGNGARVTFVCRDMVPSTNDPQAFRSLTIDIDGTDEQPLPRGILGNSSDPDVTPDGARAVFASATNPVGEDPAPGPQVYRVATDGSEMVRLTVFAEGKPKEPAVTDDGALVVFASDSDPFGLNASRLYQIFSVQADGTDLVQLTQGVQTPEPPPPRSCNFPIPRHDSDTPDVSGDGSVVVFHSRADLTGQNPSHGHRIFKVAPDGSGLQQLGTDLVGRRPRIDAAGIWVAFDDGTDVRRIRTSGTGLLTLASGTHADISAAGDVIVFQSDANYGSNPDRNTEIFFYTRTGGVEQLTFTSQGYNSQPRISGDGSWVYFLSDSPYFEESYSDARHFFRVDLETGSVERVSALSPCEEETLAVNHDGSLAVFSAGLDCTGQNPDGADELHTIDRNAQPRVFVSPGTQPTVVSWETFSGPIRYDVIRGDHASLSLPGNGTVDLGAVVCLENDSPDADTIGNEDPVLPGPGQLFFYVLRGSMGVNASPGSYGQATGGEERLPASGDCAN